MTFIAGTYTLTMGGLSLGRTDDGFFLNYGQRADMITGDNLGDIQQDGVFRGVDSVTIDAVYLEDNLVLASGVMWDLSATFGRINASGSPSNVGVLMSTLGLAFVATKVAGPNATPNSLTGLNTFLLPGSQVRRQYASRLRRVPLTIQLLPGSDTGGNGAFFSFT